MERSRRFYETALFQADRGFHDLAVFSLEQHLQLLLKACLLKLGADYPRTHSIRRLLEYLYELTGSSEVSSLLERYPVELGALEDAYITSRYVARDFSRAEFERLIGVAGEVRRVAERLSCRGG